MHVKTWSSAALHTTWLRCIIQTSVLDAMYYDVISFRAKVRVRVLVRLMHLIPQHITPDH